MAESRSQGEQLRGRKGVLALLVGAVIGVSAGPLGAAIESGSIVESVSRPQVSDLSVGVGAGAAAIAGAVGWGAGVALESRLNPDMPLTVGVEFGVRGFSRLEGKDPFNGYPVLVTRPSLTTVHILPSFYYRFVESRFSSATPFLGFSAGPVAVLSSAYSAESGDKVHASTVLLEVLLRPGLHFAWGSQFALLAETRVGLLGSIWLVQPQLNALISL